MRGTTTRLLVAALATTAAPLGAQARAPEAASFWVRLGRDTVAVERTARRTDRLEGVLVVRTPRTTLRRYVVELGPSGDASAWRRLEVRDSVPGEARLRTLLATRAGDSVRWEEQGPQGVRRAALAAPGPVYPGLPLSYALYEPMLAAFRRAAVDSLRVRTWSVGAAALGAVTVRRAGGDTVALALPSGPARARVAADGRLLWLDGRGSTFQVEVTRVAPVDVAAQATAWAALDRQGRGLGPLSPRDTVRIRLGDAELLVDYGRPAKRGRVIFGNVVPWGRVWRTGANQATHFRTTADLAIGGTHVPAGTYTLWTIPNPDGWVLILNRQTGQWGTMYDPAQDFARIPMQVRRRATPEERFTIRFEPQGEGRALLVLAWDDVEAFVPVEVHGRGMQQHHPHP